VFWFPVIIEIVCPTHVWISHEIVRIRTSDFDFVTYQSVEITTDYLDPHQSHYIFKHAPKVINPSSYFSTL